MEKISIGIVGVGGFARNHLGSIAYCAEQGLCTLTAAVIRNPEKYAEQEQQLRSKGVHVYRSMDEMLAKEKDSIQLVSIPCGIDQHRPLSVRALEAGFHVLCEKPAAGCIEDVTAMQDAEKRSGRVLAIGYQNIYSPSMQRIKQLTLNRELGKLLSAKTYALWPRTSAYYGRNYWAGRMVALGRPIMDSPMQNATAHFLNTMLYAAGPSPHESAVPAEVYGENYRAKDIESADTQFIRVKTKDGVKIEFMVSHSVTVNEGPTTEYHYENGVVYWEGMGGGRSGITKIVRTAGGTEEVLEEFDDGDVRINDLVFVNTVESIAKATTPLCTIDNAMQHTMCIQHAFDSSRGVQTIDGTYTERKAVEKELYGGLAAGTQSYNIVVPGLEEAMRGMYREGKGFAEAGLPWAKSSKVVYHTA